MFSPRIKGIQKEGVAALELSPQDFIIQGGATHSVEANPWDNIVKYCYMSWSKLTWC